MLSTTPPPRSRMESRHASVTLITPCTLTSNWSRISLRDGGVGDLIGVRDITVHRDRLPTVRNQFGSSAFGHIDVDVDDRHTGALARRVAHGWQGSTPRYLGAVQITGSSVGGGRELGNRGRDFNKSAPVRRSLPATRGPCGRAHGPAFRRPSC